MTGFSTNHPTYPRTTEGTPQEIAASAGSSRQGLGVWEGEGGDIRLLPQCVVGSSSAVSSYIQAVTAARQLLEAPSSNDVSLHSTRGWVWRSPLRARSRVQGL